MKKYILLLLPLMSFAQEDKFQKSVADVLFKKDQLYSQCEGWVATSFKSAVDLIPASNREQGLIVREFRLETKLADGNTYCTFEFHAMDGKYSVEVKDIYFKYSEGNTTITYEEAEKMSRVSQEKTMYKNYLENILKEITSLEQSLGSSIEMAYR